MQNREWAFRGVFVALFALTLYLMYRIFLPFLPGIAWAVVLVVAFRPVYERLVRWFRGREWLAATTLSLALAAFVVVPAVVAAIHAGKGVVEGYQWLETFRESEGGKIDFAARIPALANAKEFLGRFVDVESLDLQEMGLSALKTVGNALAGKSGEFVANAVQTLLTFIVMLLTMASLFHDGPALVTKARKFIPMSEADGDALLVELQQVTRSIFFGVLTTALVQGALGGIGFAIVGIPEPVTFGAAMFFFALLPGGTAIVWGPAVLWLFATGSWGKATFLLIWGVVAVSSIDNVLRPLFIGRGVRLSTLLIFFGLFGGPLVITLFLILVEVARRDMAQETAAAPPEA